MSIKPKLKSKPKHKKVLILTGSPRPNGNSTFLAGQAADGAKKAGASVEVFHLAGMNIGPCRACDGCHKKNAKGCVLRDDMQVIYPKLRAADAILIAGPVYWFNMSAYVKLFMDRLYAFGTGEFHALKGKRIGIVLTYGDADPFVSGAVNALRSFQDAFAFLGAPIIGMVCASATEPGDIKANIEAMKEARDLGRELGR